MTEFEKKASELCNTYDNITSREMLKDYAIKCIKEDNEFLAIHVLEALEFNDTQWFDYDYCMGTLETPTPLNTMEDLKDYLYEK